MVLEKPLPNLRLHADRQSRRRASQSRRQNGRRVKRCLLGGHHRSRALSKEVFQKGARRMVQSRLLSPADVYEGYFVPAMFLPWARVLLARSAPRPGERVLDVACGTGIVARQAAPLVGEGGTVVGLDMNPAMLAVARSSVIDAGPQITWREGSALDLPFPTASFDLVFCQHGLQFLPERLRAVREMHRVLVPGGRVSVMVLQALERHPVFETLMKSVARYLSMPLSSVMIPFAMYDAVELVDVFTEAGFRSIDVVAESTVVRFADRDEFVPRAVQSSAAAVPAFAKLGKPEQADLLKSVCEEVAPAVVPYFEGENVVFPMHAHVVMATS